MIYHIVSWKLNDDILESDREAVKSRVKESLESLKNEVEGVIDIKVITNPLSSSNVDITLFSQFNDEKALSAYQVSEGHVKAAEYIRSVFCNRTCIDFEQNE